MYSSSSLRGVIHSLLVSWPPSVINWYLRPKGFGKLLFGQKFVYFFNIYSSNRRTAEELYTSWSTRCYDWSTAVIARGMIFPLGCCLLPFLYLWTYVACGYIYWSRVVCHLASKIFWICWIRYSWGIFRSWFLRACRRGVLYLMYACSTYI
jgi:hypothetical protein